MTALSSRMQQLFDNSKTVCFGRFVFEVPKTAVVVFGPTEVETPLQYYPGEGKRISQHLTELSQEIEKERVFLGAEDFARMPMFGKIVDGNVTGQKILFGSKNHATYSMYSIAPVEEDMFVQHVHAVFPSDDEVERLIDIFNRVATHIRPRNQDEIPVESGTCIDGAFAPIDLKYEKVSVGVRLREFPDVHFSVEVHKNQDRLIESSELEPLVKEAEEQGTSVGLGPVYARVITFRRGQRELGVWTGFEIAVRKPAYKRDTDAHEFHFRSLGALNDSLRPQLDVQLDTGANNNRKAAVRPSITDAEAVALWDKLIGSIRVRFPSDGKPKDHGSPKVPLGELTPTGGTCGQTGWWQCAESGSIDDAKRRYFTAGEILPEAIFFDEMSLWNKVTGNRPTSSRSTLWRFVSYGGQQAPSESA